MQDSGSAGGALTVAWPASAWRMPSISFSCALDVPGGRGVRYWEVDDSQPPTTPKLPYRIELVGVTCDPGLAVARGIWCASSWWPCIKCYVGSLNLYVEPRAGDAVVHGHRCGRGTATYGDKDPSRLGQQCPYRVELVGVTSDPRLGGSICCAITAGSRTSARVCGCFFSVMHSCCSWSPRTPRVAGQLPRAGRRSLRPRFAVARGTCVSNPIRAGEAPCRSGVSACTGGRTSDLPGHSKCCLSNGPRWPGRPRAGAGYARGAACRSTCSCARTACSRRTSRSLRTWWTPPRCTTRVRFSPSVPCYGRAGAFWPTLWRMSGSALGSALLSTSCTHFHGYSWCGFNRGCVLLSESMKLFLRLCPNLPPFPPMTRK